VLLYTDGISEATNVDGELFGEKRLCECVQALPAALDARDVTAHVLTSVRRFLGDVEPQDDITLLVLRVLEPAHADGDAAPAPEALAVRLS
jgi:serine phosphatase RsbU (regulator of sigma subunit)